MPLIPSPAVVGYHEQPQEGYEGGKRRNDVGHGGSLQHRLSIAPLIVGDIAAGLQHLKAPAGGVELYRKRHNLEYQHGEEKIHAYHGKVIGAHYRAQYDYIRRCG